MTVRPDPLRARASDVDALASSLRRGGSALDDVPALLERVLTEESWREFVTQRGEEVRHERFADFVVTPPLAGLGSTVDLVRRIVSDKVVVLDLLDQALQGKVGAHSNNVTRTPKGNSSDAALRRLRKDRPDLHAEVLHGNLSAHAAAVAAGFRPRTITVRADSPESIAATLRRQLDAEQIAELARLLQEG